MPGLPIRVSLNSLDAISNDTNHLNHHIPNHSLEHHPVDNVDIISNSVHITQLVLNKTIVSVTHLLLVLTSHNSHTGLGYLPLPLTPCFRQQYHQHHTHAHTFHWRRGQSSCPFIVMPQVPVFNASRLGQYTFQIQSAWC